jgi:WD40 repeat protein
MTLRTFRILILLLTLAPVPVAAQYFGRNKVQYENFDFEILRTDHFDVHYYSAEAEATRDAARMGERWYDRYSQLFRHEFSKRKPVVFYADKPDFQQTNTTSGLISEGTGGFTEGLKNRVVMPFAETQASTDHVLGHELVHAFQYDLALGQAAASGGSGFYRLPLWVVEGLAEYLSIGREDAHTAMWLRDALEQDNLPTIDDLSTDPDYFPYRFGHAFWAYVGGNWSDSIVAVLYEVATEKGINSAVRQVLSVDPDSLSEDWKKAIEEQYGPLLEGRTPPSQVGDRILAEGDEDDWSLAPVISPDGSRVVFLSQRNLFTIDLYIADARTGAVQGQLTSTLRNAHFDALAFLNSAGSWSPDGNRFAFVTFSEGDNEVAIANVADREVVRTLDLGDVSAVHDVAWSPDGGSIAVSGMKGGITDLYLVDLENGRVEQLTNDRYAELNPSWSPDGGTIAFATDRGSPQDLERIDLPSMGLGFLDRASGEIRVERPFQDAKHINPQFSPDGTSVYFISDHGGFSDIYRLDRTSGQLFQVTRITTGVSGITEHAPALSVARQTGRLMFSVFQESDYIGYALDADRARGEPVDPTAPLVASAALLPPGPASEDRVAQYLAHSERGLPEGQRFATSDYSSDLSLDFVAPPTAGVAVDRFGGAIGGSVGFFFSDMLGDRQMAIAAIANGGAKDIGGEIAFASLGGRSNWGVRAGRLPFRTVSAAIQPCEIDGQLLDCVDVFLERWYQTGGEVAGEYPFSMTRRVEGAVGFTRYDFDFEVQRAIYQGGILVATDEFDLDELEPEALNLANAAVALVDDYSFFGFTSPVQGGRARFEVGGNFGTLNFGTLLADYRRYFFARPVTFAVRGLHYGRYGGDADDEEGRLRPLFIGYETLVRGYGAGSFTPAECTDVGDEDGSCPEFDRLIGSKIAVVNAELRVPLFGAEEYGLLGAGFLPIELALFVDGGTAWTGDESPELKFERDSTERIPVFSTGASLRINLFGAVIGEVYYAYPFQRPVEGAHIGFQLAPGW